MANGITPTDFTRRSPLYRTLLVAGADFAEIGGAAVAEGFGDDPDSEDGALAEMSISDLTPLWRSGFKGLNALDWLRRQGLSIGGEDNHATPQKDGALALRLSPTEALILADLSAADEPNARLESEWTIDGAPDCYPVPRRGANYWFLVAGRHADKMFAKTCGVDFRTAIFPVNSVAQTSVARSNAIVVRVDLARIPAYYLLGDSASAVYMWDCLADAMAEFGGKPVGFSAVRRAIGT